MIFDFGGIALGIGPTVGAPYFKEPTQKKLDLMGHNPHAVYQLVLDFKVSPLLDKGIKFTIDGVEIRLGPQRDPIVIERKRAVPLR